VTFNAAGLNSRALAKLGVNYSSADASRLIHAYFVKGEILSLLQDITPLPDAAGTRIALSPGNGLGYFSPFAHSIKQVDAALR
jgi:hypothetical protein